MEALELNELVVTKLAEGLAFTRVLPTRPREILLELATCNIDGTQRSYGARIVTSIDKYSTSVNIFC